MFDNMSALFFIIFMAYHSLGFQTGENLKNKGGFYELIDPSLGFQTDENLKNVISCVVELAFQCL